MPFDNVHASVVRHLQDSLIRDRGGLSLSVQQSLSSPWLSQFLPSRVRYQTTPTKEIHRPISPPPPRHSQQATARVKRLCFRVFFFFERNFSEFFSFHGRAPFSPLSCFVPHSRSTSRHGESFVYGFPRRAKKRKHPQPRTRPLRTTETQKPAAGQGLTGAPPGHSHCPAPRTTPCSPFPRLLRAAAAHRSSRTAARRHGGGGGAARRRRRRPSRRRRGGGEPGCGGGGGGNAGVRGGGHVVAVPVRAPGPRPVRRRGGRRLPVAPPAGAAARPAPPGGQSIGRPRMPCLFPLAVLVYTAKRRSRSRLSLSKAAAAGWRRRAWLLPPTAALLFSTRLLFLKALSRFFTTNFHQFHLRSAVPLTSTTDSKGVVIRDARADSFQFAMRRPMSFQLLMLGFFAFNLICGEEFVAFTPTSLSAKFVGVNVCG